LFLSRSDTGLERAVDDVIQERFPITWNHVIEGELLNSKELEHVLIEKVERLFRDIALMVIGNDDWFNFGILLSFLKDEIRERHQYHP
jgi:hypothetical protein